MNLSKLNHILIPKKSEDLERMRRAWYAKYAYTFVYFFFMFSTEGQWLLIGWVMLSALSINVEFTQYYVVWSVVTGLLFASLLLRRGLILRGVSLHFTAPPRVTVGEEVHLLVEIHNQGDSPHQALRIERPFLSWDGRYLNPRPFVEHIAPQQSLLCPVKARFVARGEHNLGAASVRALTPLGFGLGPPVYSEPLRFLVIPRIAQVTHVHVDMVMRYQPGGIALASITGESREIVGVRPYRPGDPVRDLHAKTWARIGMPVVREYQQEYFTRIGIVIDTDGGEADDPVFEAMLSLAAGITAQLSRGEVLLDILVIGDDIHQLTLGRSLGFLEQALDLLACVAPKKGFQSETLQAQLTGHLERLSCMLFLSLKWDTSRQHFTDWIEQQGTACRKILVVGQTPPDHAQAAGATLVQAKDIQQNREISV
jgi:uncharacterized protein (DUF58 family)